MTQVEGDIREVSTARGVKRNPAKTGAIGPRTDHESDDMSARKKDRKAPEEEPESVTGEEDRQHESTGEETEQAENAPQKTVASALGEIAWLLSQSPNHRHSLFLGDLEWLVMPPLTLAQYRLFYANEKPVGVAFWAFVNEQVEQRLAGGSRLGASEWRSGDRVWLVEIVAPFGGQDRILADLQETVLAERRFRYIRMQANGKRETVEVTGDAAG